MWKIDFITHLLRIHDLDQQIYVVTFQYFVCRPDGDCFKSAGTCPYKTYVRISNTPRVSDQRLYDSVKQFSHLFGL